MLAVHKISGAGNVLVILATLVLLGALASWYWREFKKLRARTRRVRAWRARIGAAPARPFHLGLLSNSERYQLIGHGGVNSEQWMRAVVADFRTGLRDTAPTCGEYLKAFGRHPRVRPARRM